MRKLLTVATIILGCALLAGCASATPQHRKAPHLTQVPSPTPTPSTDPTQPLAEVPAGPIWVRVYAQAAFHASRGCGCTAQKSSKEEMFPKGTPVMMLRIALAGIRWGGDGNRSTQDVTGVTLNGTKFDGRPELAVLATRGGKKAATAAGLPWLPHGLFKGQSTWKITDGKESSFVVAWYVPRGVDHLLLTVNVPSQSAHGPITLTVPLPADVTAMLGVSGE